MRSSWTPFNRHPEINKSLGDDWLWIVLISFFLWVLYISGSLYIMYMSQTVEPLGYKPNSMSRIHHCSWCIPQFNRVLQYLLFKCVGCDNHSIVSTAAKLLNGSLFYLNHILLCKKSWQSNLFCSISRAFIMVIMQYKVHLYNFRINNQFSKTIVKKRKTTTSVYKNRDNHQLQLYFQFTGIFVSIDAFMDANGSAGRSEVSNCKRASHMLYLVSSKIRTERENCQETVCLTSH